MNIFPREQFPLLNRKIQGKQLVYFDNAATSPKPQVVLDAIVEYYSNHAGNPGRSTHTLALDASEIIELTRESLLKFLNGTANYSVIFTKSATESINVIAHSIEFQYRLTEKKPTILVSEAEHHSNLLPWLRLHQEYGFPLTIIPVNKDGLLETATIQEYVKKAPNSILAITHCSNVTGQVIDIEKVLPIAKENGITIILDASQSIAHTTIDLTKLDVDFLVASAHKMYGPEGVGIIVAKKSRVAEMHPLLLGGGMVDSVSVNTYTPKLGVEKFEAGTPNTAGISGLNAAIQFIESIGFEAISEQEAELTQKLIHELITIPEITVLNKEYTLLHAPVVSFYCGSIHPHDISDSLDKQGIAVRAGYHCAEPLHQAMGIKGTVRVSLSFLNTQEEILYFITTLKACLQKFA